MPHIFADTMDAAIYASGRAQARLHGDLLLELFAVARGKASEYFGAGPVRPGSTVGEYEQSDQFTWANEWPVLHDALYDQLFDDELAAFEAFAAGFTDYIMANEEDFMRDRLRVLPITARDVSAHQHRQFMLFTVIDSKNPTLPGSTRDQVSLLQADGQGDSGEGATGKIYAHDLDFSKLRAEFGDIFGSNMWAINGAKSDGRGAKLVMNPHLAYVGFQLFTELQITVPDEDLNIYGAALVGNTVPVIAFNDYLGWSHTVNVVQNYVNYVVPGFNDTHYLYNGEVLPYSEATYEFQVRESNDMLTTRTVSVFHTVHGQLFDFNATHVLVSRWAGTDRAHAQRQRLDMIKAKNAAEFKAALSQLEYGFFHTAGATRDGDIFNYWAGFVPDRDESLGDWFYWQKPVDGSTNATFFTDIHPFEDLPAVENPPSNFVQQANEPPWTMTLPLVDKLNPERFPSYMSLPPTMTPRAQTSARLMIENTNITFEQLVELKHSTVHHLANNTIDDLVAAVSARTNATAALMNASAILQAWDRNLDADSVGAILFLVWQASSPPDLRAEESVLGQNATTSSTGILFSTPWSIDDPLNTPRDFADTEAVVNALEAAYNALVALPDPWAPDVAYGDIFRLLDPRNLTEGATVPGHGGPATFRNTVWPININSAFTYDTSTPPAGGDSWVCVVEFTQDGPRAEGLIGYGQSSQPNSPHFNDQWGLYANKTLRPIWRDYDVIRANLESNETVSFVRGGDNSTTAPTPSPTVPEDPDTTSPGDPDDNARDGAPVLGSRYAFIVVGVLTAFCALFLC